MSTRVSTELQGGPAAEIDRSLQSRPAVSATATPFWQFLFPLLLVASAVRTSRLADSLWYDELWSTRIKLDSVWAFVVSTASDAHPPGYAALMFVWIRLFGDSEWSVRAVALLAGLVTVLLLYRLGRLAFDEYTGRLSAVLLAISPVHVWYSQEARSYALTVMLMVLGALAVAELRRRPDSRPWALALAAALLILPWLHFYTLGAVLLLAAVAYRRPAARRVRLLSLAGGISMVAVLVYAGIRSQLGMLAPAGDYLRTFTLVEWWRLLFTWFLTGDGLQWILRSEAITRIATFVIQAVTALVLTLGLWRSINARSPDARLCLALFAALPALLFGLAVAGFGSSYVERSALAALPFFVLLLAAGLTGWSRQPIAAGALIALMAIGLTGSLARSDTWTVYKPREDWRELAAWIGPHLKADEPQALLIASDPAVSLAYYSPEFAERIDFVSKLQERGDRISARLDRFGLNAAPILAWVARGADAAETRSRAARVLIVDPPLVASTMDALLAGRIVTSVIVVQVGGGEAPRSMRRLAGSPRFKAGNRQQFRGLRAQIFAPMRSSIP